MITKKFSFLVCYHKETPRLNTEIFSSVHVGRALASAAIPDTVGDDTGDNISDRNKSYCELTAMYWMLHNVEAEYYGIFHYRRMLNFSGTDREMFHDFSPRTRELFGWTEQAVSSKLADFDILTGPRWNVHPNDVPSLPMTNYDFYRREHVIKDMDTMLAVTREKYPEIFPYVDAYMNQKTCFYGNVFVMRGDIYRRYATWLFDILFETERRSDVSGYNVYQARVWGFLAERLMGAFTDYAVDKLGARAGQLQMVPGHFEKPAISAPRILRAMRRRRNAARSRAAIAPIHVAMLVSHADAPRAGATLQTARRSLPPGQKLHVHLITDDDFPEDQRARFRKFARGDTEISLYSGIPLDDIYPRFTLPEERLQLLNLQDILPDDVEKVIVLDHGLAVVEGLDLLWQSDLQGALAGACPHEGGVLHARRLNFTPGTGYFDAGVMVLDLAAMRAMNVRSLYRAAFDALAPVVIRGAEDILNIAMRGRYRELPLNWNVTDRFYRRNTLEYRYAYADACKAAHDPAIVHFTGDAKPWHRRCGHPLAFLYWQGLGATPWTRTRAWIVGRAIRASLPGLLRR